MTKILRMTKEGPKQVAIYSMDTKQAIIAYVLQAQGNWNTWEYPDTLPLLRRTSRGNWIYDDEANGLTVAAYPYK